MTAAPSLRPEPPLAKRLNRNALTVGAVLMGMTVLTAVVLVHPSHETEATPGAEPVMDRDLDTPSRPTFLDQPAQVRLSHSDSVSGGLPLRGGAGEGELALRLPNNAENPQAGARLAPDAQHAPSGPALGGAGDPEGVPLPGSDVPGVGRSSGRTRAYHAALTSPSLAQPLPAPVAASLPPAVPDPNGRHPDAPLAAEEARLLGLGDSVLRAAAGSGSGDRLPGGAGPAPGPAPLPSRGENSHRAFLDGAGDAKGAAVLARLEPAGSPYTLRAGTVIPGALLTGINADLPGDLVAQVSRDVYDSRTQRLVLIPRGARLIGTYDNQIVAGEDRLLVAWTRLILPDGRSFKLPGLMLKDVQGQTGAKDQVDTHWRQAFGNALLLSAISAGVQLSQPQQSSVFAPPSAGQVAAGAVGQELSNVALEILRHGMSQPPTITIRQGQPFNVFLNGDLVFDGPYEDQSRVAP